MFLGWVVVEQETGLGTGMICPLYPILGDPLLNRQMGRLESLLYDKTNAFPLRITGL